MVYLLLGSNVGNRLANLSLAQYHIKELIGPISLESKIYLTPPWGITEQAAFLNQAIGLETALRPLELLAQLKAIEKKVGRVDTVRWGPRVMDIDILLMDGTTFSSEELQVPHIALPERRFALHPLAEIAGDIIHPVLGATIRQLLEQCKDHSIISPYEAD